PDDRAAVAVQMDADGDDQDAALRALEQKSGVPLLASADHRVVNGLRAVHTTAEARTRDGRVALDLTWIGFGGHVYRITGASTPSDANAMRPSFRATADSFRALTAGERASIHELRLDVVTAGAGDTLEKIRGRAAARWKVETAAIANGLEPTAALRAGDPIKVATKRAYTARAR